MKKQILTLTALVACVLFTLPGYAQQDSVDIEIEAIEEAAEEAEEAAEEAEEMAEEIEEMVEEILEEVFEDVEDQIEGRDEQVIIDGRKIKVIVKEKRVVTGSQGQDSTIEVVEQVIIDGDHVEVEEGGEHVIIDGEHVEVINGEEHVVIQGFDHEGHHDPQKHRTKIVTTDMFNMQLGLNNTLNAAGDLEMPEGFENLELSAGRSVNFHLHFVQQALSLYRENVRFIYGLGIDFNNYRFNRDVVLGEDSMGVMNGTINDDVEYRKNKLVTQYLTMPLMLNFQFGPERQDKFKVSVGANLGYLIRAHQKLKWNENGTQKSKIRDDYNLEKFRIGYEVQFGYGNFTWYVKYFPESMFKAGQGPELRSVSAGLLIGSI